jgi:hypothetical protein
MLNVLWCLLAAARSLLKTQRELALENLALRHQIGVLNRALGKRRLGISPCDRGLWVVLSRLWSGWQQALSMVQPATVIRWHREGFKRFWTKKTRTECGGRPAVDRKVRALIRRMSRANVTSGAPRIRNELCKIGIQVSRSVAGVGLAATGSQPERTKPNRMRAAHASPSSGTRTMPWARSGCQS